MKRTLAALGASALIFGFGAGTAHAEGNAYGNQVKACYDVPNVGVAMQIGRDAHGPGFGAKAAALSATHCSS